MAAADEPLTRTAESIRPGTLRGRPGFFRAGQDCAGRWWLLSADERLVFARAVHGVMATAPTTDGSLPPDSATRLRTWGFDTLGTGSAPELREDGLDYLGCVGFDAAGPLLSAPGMRLPDVFDPGWPQLAHARASAVCAPLATTRELVGWVTDDALAWAQPGAANAPTLLQLCLALEPHHAAYHAAWEFVLALHGGRLPDVERAWETSLPNKEVLRELTRAETPLTTRGYLRDQARWTREFGHRYFRSTGVAIRAVDPNHLVFGCRFRRPVGAHVLAACAYPDVDVAMTHWLELPGPAAIAGRPAGPVLAGDLAWPVPRRDGGRSARRGLTGVERMLQRGRAALLRIARHPLALGYAWSQWQDEPGEQPPFARGLMHLNGAEAREHTELLADFNARVLALRRPAVHPLSS